MAVHIELHPAAVAEAAQAHSWYLERSRAVAEAFFRELENALTRIAVTPDRWPRYMGGTRRYLLSRFPYLVVYRARAERVETIAIAHAKRHPGYWRDRTT